MGDSGGKLLTLRNHSRSHAITDFTSASSFMLVDCTLTLGAEEGDNAANTLDILAKSFELTISELMRGV